MAQAFTSIPSQSVGYQEGDEKSIEKKKILRKKLCQRVSLVEQVLAANLMKGTGMRCYKDTDNHDECLFCDVEALLQEITVSHSKARSRRSLQCSQGTSTMLSDWLSFKIPLKCCAHACLKSPHCLSNRIGLRRRLLRSKLKQRNGENCWVHLQNRTFKRMGVWTPTRLSNETPFQFVRPDRLQQCAYDKFMRTPYFR